METNQTAQIIFSVIARLFFSVPKRRTGGECQTSSDSAANPLERKNLFLPLRFKLFFSKMNQSGKGKAATLHGMGVSSSPPATCTHVYIGKTALLC